MEEQEAHRKRSSEHGRHKARLSLSQHQAQRLNEDVDGIPEVCRPSDARTERWNAHHRERWLEPYYCDHERKSVVRSGEQAVVV